MTDMWESNRIIFRDRSNDSALLFKDLQRQIIDRLNFGQHRKIMGAKDWFKACRSVTKSSKILKLIDEAEKAYAKSQSDKTAYMDYLDTDPSLRNGTQSDRT